MSQLMRAAIAYKFGQPLVVEKIPIPTINSHQIIVKIIASGVCHTDLHAINGDWPVKPMLPLVPGHEGAGIVVKVGKDIDFIKEGDRVGIPWLHSACGFCEYCLTGWETLCHTQKNTGYSVNGCYAEYVAVNPFYVAHLPQELDYFAAASILCAGLTVYKGIKETETKPGDWLVVSGVGGLGHMAIQYGKAMGLKIIAIDIHKKALDLAKSLNADLVINSNLENPVDVVNKHIGGAKGIIVAAVTSIAFQQAVSMLKRGGILSMVGLPPADINLSIFDMVLNRKTVRGSIVGTRMDLSEALAFAAEGKVCVHYKKEKLENINSIFSDMKNGNIKGRIVIQM